MRYRAWIQALHSHRNAVWVGARNVEGSDTTHLAEVMLSCVGVEGVESEILLGGLLKLEVALGDYEVNVSSHRTVRAVAVPHHDAPRRRHFVPHSLAVTSPVMLHWRVCHCDEEKMLDTRCADTQGQSEIKAPRLD